jgi:hypothetical protein
MRAKEALPPAGGRQNLRKPMPRHTRYVGESHEAWDIKNRYDEHMRKQRADTVQSRPETGNE